MKNQTRRRFLQSTIGTSLAVGIDARVPRSLVAAAETESQSNEKILVVVQLSGGNDGLNTVIPYADENYRKLRPTLAVPIAEAIKIDDHVALHPSLDGMASLMDDGLCTIVQGVGYDNPNRSHFESMDIWHSCRRKGQSRSDGWIGRFLDANRKMTSGAVPALHFGSGQQPVALLAREVRVPSVQSLDEFRLKSDRAEAFRELVQQLASASGPAESNAQNDLVASQAGANDLLGFVQSSTAAALVASDQVEQALDSYDVDTKYPDTELASKLSIIARLIDSDIGARIYYVELDGFDTHAEQGESHAVLLRQWSDAVTAFVRDTAQHGHGERVCVMTFSEFGRRVEENASRGTDHGAAAPLFLAGGGLAAPLFGDQPSLVDLVDGDLKHSIDFRQVYSTLVNDWLSADAKQVVGSGFELLPLFRSHS